MPNIMMDLDDWYDVLQWMYVFDFLNFEDGHCLSQTCKKVYFCQQPNMGNRRKNMLMTRLKSVQEQCYMLTCPFTLKNFEIFVSNTLSSLNGETPTSFVNMGKVYETPPLFEGVFMTEERLCLLHHISHIVDSCHKPRGMVKGKCYANMTSPIRNFMLNPKDSTPLNPILEQILLAMMFPERRAPKCYIVSFLHPHDLWNLMVLNRSFCRGTFKDVVTRTFMAFGYEAILCLNQQHEPFEITSTPAPTIRYDIPKMLVKRKQINWQITPTHQDMKKPKVVTKKRKTPTQTELLARKRKSLWKERMRVPDTVEVRKSVQLRMKEIDQLKKEMVPIETTTIIIDKLHSDLKAGFLSTNVAKLVLGDYNHPIREHGLPPCLKTLKLSNNFNSYLAIWAIPATLEELVFGKAFNRSFTFTYTFPPALKTLIFGDDFNKPIPPTFQFPGSLDKLVFGKSFDHTIYPGNLPISLRILSFGQQFSQKLPTLPSIEKLTLGEAYNHSFRFPDSLTFLQLGNKFSRSITTLPSNLSTLVIGHRFNNALPTLPPKLTSLHLGHAFNHPLPTLPPGLQQLHLGNAFNQPLPQPLPSSLKTFVCGQGFHRSLMYEQSGKPKSCLPQGLSVLELGAYHYKLAFLPKSLTRLVIPNTYNITNLCPASKGWSRKKSNSNFIFHRTTTV